MLNVDTHPTNKQVLPAWWLFSFCGRANITNNESKCDYVGLPTCISFLCTTLDSVRSAKNIEELYPRCLPLQKSCHWAQVVDYRLHNKQRNKAKAGYRLWVTDKHLPGDHKSNLNIYWTRSNAKLNFTMKVTFKVLWGCDFTAKPLVWRLNYFSFLGS